MRSCVRVLAHMTHLLYHYIGIQPRGFSLLFVTLLLFKTLIFTIII